MTKNRNIICIILIILSLSSCALENQKNNVVTSDSDNYNYTDLEISFDNFRYDSGRRCVFFENVNIKNNGKISAENFKIRFCLTNDNNIGNGDDIVIEELIYNDSLGWQQYYFMTSSF